jgi:hypothetical protein
MNAYLAGTVEEDIYKAKSNELKSEGTSAAETLATLCGADSARGEIALAVFDFT